MSQIIRNIIDKYSEIEDELSLSAMSGIAENSKAYGREHDKWLYGRK